MYGMHFTCMPIRVKMVAEATVQQQHVRTELEWISDSGRIGFLKILTELYLAEGACTAAMDGGLAHGG